MWKKEDDMNQNPTTAPASGAAAPAKTASPTPSHSGRDQATIGRSINIRGDVTGDEDLLIQGRIEGTVDLKQHSVTIGPEGRVKADLKGRKVTGSSRTAPPSSAVSTCPAKHRAAAPPRLRVGQRNRRPMATPRKAGRPTRRNPAPPRTE